MVVAVARCACRREVDRSRARVFRVVGARARTRQSDSLSLGASGDVAIGGKLMRKYRVQAVTITILTCVCVALSMHCASACNRQMANAGAARDRDRVAEVELEIQLQFSSCQSRR